LQVFDLVVCKPADGREVIQDCFSATSPGNLATGLSREGKAVAGQ
jgi:hypothetical protein